MNRTTRFARSPFRVRRALCAGAALIVGVAACAQPKSGPGPAPTPTAAKDSRELQATSEMGQSPNQPIEQYLASRSAGVVIGHASDGSLTVRIRGGSSSTYGNNAPLYIIDGVPFQPAAALRLLNVDGVLDRILVGRPGAK